LHWVVSHPPPLLAPVIAEGDVAERGGEGHMGTLFFEQPPAGYAVAAGGHVHNLL